MKRLVFSFLLCVLGCLSVAHAQDIPALKSEALAYIENNRPDEALPCYEKILALDAKSYDALAFLSNYHFIRGRKGFENAEKNYRSIEEPTRMQMAQYQNELRQLYATFFEKAERYLVRAILLQRNDHLDQMAAYIADYKKMIDNHLPVPLK
jgi:tetratricopeptide (TPR) repeat protein